MSTKKIYRHVDRLRTRNRNSAKYKTVEQIFTKTGMDGGSLGTSFTDTDEDSFSDKIPKTRRAQAIKPS